MTTAHRPTFDPARGREAERGPAYHQRLLPAHQTLKYRQATQGTVGEHSTRDLKAELLRAERRAQAIKAGHEVGDEDEDVAHLDDMTTASGSGPSSRKALEDGHATREDVGTSGADADQDDEDYETKRQRVLDATRDVDAASEEDSDADGSDDSDDQDSEDETAELMRELAKIKRERAEAAAREAEIKRKQDEDEREKEIARGNPLLNAPGPAEYGVKRRWDDDVVFKNQARGTSEREKGRSKEFVNDLLRSDFHKRFMTKYVR